MNILVIGEATRRDELLKRLPTSANFTWKPDFSAGFLTNDDLQAFDYIFDLNFDDNPANLNYYARLDNVPVLVSAAKISLAEQFSRYTNATNQYNIVGVNFLPTFINRDKTEVSQLRPSNKRILAKLENELGLNPLIVSDRVGMVTPRVICMIINEAFYTLQEGTATVEDIDQGMKLGTNYPMGPFEWADKIGISHVYELLRAVYEDTKDPRYQVCPLLKNLVLTRGTIQSLSV